MNTPLPTLPPKPSPVARWGPVVGIVAVVALVGALAVAGGGDEASTGGGTTPLGTAGGAVAEVPITYAQAKEAGSVDSYKWVDNCDTATGRLAMPSIFAPPCVPAFDGDNGGATYPGVTEDTIRIAVYVPEANNDLLATLQGKLDDPEVAARTSGAFMEMMTDLYETYGRRIELVQFQGTGAANDETAAIADAREVAQDLNVFASLGGPVLTGAYAAELARNGVLCLGCGTSNPDSSYQDNAPFWWGSQATAEQFLWIVGDFVGGHLVGREAEFAGSDEIRGKQRKFGVVHFEQDVPVFGEVEDEVAERGKERGYVSSITETYTFDLATMPERARSIIAKMKEQDVTSIIFLGDPIMPIYLTQEATSQDYYPEWIVTGTVLTDTTVLGRMYDQSQWAHAFGLSSLPARAPRELGVSWRLHEWYFGAPPEAKNTQAIVFGNISQLWLGIHLAGENLNPETFKAGLFGYPPTGGGPTTPQISFGEHGWFTNPDYLGIDDMTVVWWDADLVGTDEQGVEEAGVYRYANGGERYLPGEMAPDSVQVFEEEGSIIEFETLPEGDEPPTYPPPERGAGCPPGGCAPIT